MGRSRRAMSRKPFKTSTTTFVRRKTKDWEDKLWIPYIIRPQALPWSTDPGAPNITSCGVAKRIVSFIAPALAEDVTGQAPEYTRATDKEFRLVGIDGEVLVTVDHGGANPDHMVLFWQWMKERTAPTYSFASASEYTELLAPAAIQPSDNSAFAAMTAKRIMSHGTIFLPNPKSINGADYQVADHGMQKIPLPRLPKAGMLLGASDSLTLLCSVTVRPGTGSTGYNAGALIDWRDLAENDSSLPSTVRFTPLLRFLVTE